MSEEERLERENCNHQASKKKKKKEEDTYAALGIGTGTGAPPLPRGVAGVSTRDSVGVVGAPVLESRLGAVGERGMGVGRAKGSFEGHDKRDKNKE